MRDYLLELRESTSSTQQDVAGKIGITSQYYQMIESGRRQPCLNTLMIGKLASVFGKSAGDIYEMEMAYQNERKEILRAQGEEE